MSQARFQHASNLRCQHGDLALESRISQRLTPKACGRDPHIDQSNEGKFLDTNRDTALPLPPLPLWWLRVITKISLPETDGRA